MFDYRARTAAALLPSDVMFNWPVRHAACCLTRLQPCGTFGITAYVARNGVAYKSPLAAFGEAVTVRAPFDPLSLHKTLDQRWATGIWVGRMGENDGNIIVTPNGIVKGRSTRRLAPDMRHQPDLVKAVQSRVSDPVRSRGVTCSAASVAAVVGALSS